jgi:hypothetical protein
MADLSPLQRQRRFLILMSLGVIAFYWLKAGVSNTATFSGVVVSLGRPEGVAIGLWIIWGWAFLRYGQRVYELLSVLWGELLEDVFAEDQRIALRRAKSCAKRLAELGKLTADHPSWKDVLVIGPVHNNNQDMPAFLPKEGGGRKYEHLGATIRWGGDEAPGISTTSFQMEMTPWQVRWLRCRAWTYAIFGLPAFTEHIAPICLALVVPFAPCFG